MKHKHVKAMLIGIGAAYIALGGLLFSLHPEPVAISLDLAAPLIISVIGIIVAFASYSQPAGGPAAPVSSDAICVSSKPNPIQAISLAASGFFLGALLSHLVKLFA